MGRDIALDAIDAGSANLTRRRSASRSAKARSSSKFPKPQETPILAERDTDVDPPVADPVPTAAFAAGLISHQEPASDALLDRQHRASLESPLPERSDLPLTDRLV